MQEGICFAEGYLSSAYFRHQPESRAVTRISRFCIVQLLILFARKLKGSCGPSHHLYMRGTYPDRRGKLLYSQQSHLSSCKPLEHLYPDSLLCFTYIYLVTRWLRAAQPIDTSRVPASLARMRSAVRIRPAAPKSPVFSRKQDFFFTFFANLICGSRCGTVLTHTVTHTRKCAERAKKERKGSSAIYQMAFAAFNAQYAYSFIF